MRKFTLITKSYQEGFCNVHFVTETFSLSSCSFQHSLPLTSKEDMVQLLEERAKYYPHLNQLPKPIVVDFKSTSKTPSSDAISISNFWFSKRDSVVGDYWLTGDAAVDFKKIFYSNRFMYESLGIRHVNVHGDLLALGFNIENTSGIAFTLHPKHSVAGLPAFKKDSRVGRDTEVRIVFDEMSGQQAAFYSNIGESLFLFQKGSFNSYEFCRIRASWTKTLNIPAEHNRLALIAKVSDIRIGDKIFAHKDGKYLKGEVIKENQFSYDIESFDGTFTVGKRASYLFVDYLPLDLYYTQFELNKPYRSFCVNGIYGLRE